MLLGDVRELEVQAECPKHERLLCRRNNRYGLRDRRDLATLTRRARQEAHLLDGLQELRPHLLDEDVAEDRPEQADVAPKRLVDVSRCRHAPETTRASVESRAPPPAPPALRVDRDARPHREPVHQEAE